MPFVRGIDVHPSYQTVTDWAKVASAVDFMFQKATEHTSFRTPNSYFRTGKAKGLLVGAYHFFRPGYSVNGQADLFVDWLKDAGWQRGRDLPPVLDLERTDGLPDNSIRSLALAFMNRVESRLGIGDDPWQRCAIYMNGDWRNRMGSTLTSGRVLWLASWPSEFRGKWPTDDGDKPAGAGVWQFTDRMDIPGITENTDGDVAWLEDLRRMAPLFYGNQPEDDMPLTDADVKKVAKAVWDHRLNPGAFADRIAGYDPDATYPAGGLLVGGDAYGRELHAVLPAILAGIAKLGEPGLSDEERRALAADVASQVNQWRVVMERVEES